MILKERGKEPKAQSPYQVYPYRVIFYPYPAEHHAVVLFSSQKTPQPFLDPSIMNRKTASMTNK